MKDHLEQPIKITKKKKKKTRETGEMVSMVKNKHYSCKTEF